MALIEQLIQRLKEAKGDIRAQSAATAEFVMMTQPEAEREAFRAALDAAALLRWFDASLLGKMLNTPQEEARRRFEALKTLPFVERYRRSERDLRNVHESTRLGLRIQLARETVDRFRALSARAAACFAEDLTTAGRIEWTYHLLCGDPERGATELEKLDRNWGSSARPEDYDAMAAALRELEDTKLVQGRARVWSQIVIAWSRHARGETAQLADVAAGILRLARASAVSDQRAEADAQCLLGAAMEAQGKLPKAQGAYAESLAISRQLAAQDPSSAGSKRELAVAHSRVGGVLEAQGKLAEAQAAFGEFLAISRRLAEQDPSNAGWQRELAVAHSRVGDVSQAQGKLAEAQAAFGENLAISQRLAEQDPSNAGWQRELAVALSKVGDVLQAQGKLAEAQAAFGEYLAISQRLAEQDPSNAGWQRELAVALSKVGDVLQAQGKLAEAQATFEARLTISRRLAKLDPLNMEWRRGLGVALLRLARLDFNSGRHGAALPLFEEAGRIFTALVQEAPDFVQWAKDKENVESELALCRVMNTVARVSGKNSDNEITGAAASNDTAPEDK